MPATGEIVRGANSIVMCLFSPAVPAGRRITRSLDESRGAGPRCRRPRAASRVARRRSGPGHAGSARARRPPSAGPLKDPSRRLGRAGSGLAGPGQTGGTGPLGRRVGKHWPSRSDPPPSHRPGQRAQRNLAGPAGPSCRASPVGDSRPARPPPQARAQGPAALVTAASAGRAEPVPGPVGEGREGRGRRGRAGSIRLCGYA